MSGISDRLLEKRLWGLRPTANKIPPTSVVVFRATLMNLSELERDLVVKFVCPNSLYFKDMVFHGDSGCPNVIDLTPKRACDVASSVNLTNSVVEVRNVRLEDDTSRLASLYEDKYNFEDWEVFDMWLEILLGNVGVIADIVKEYDYILN